MRDAETAYIVFARAPLSPALPLQRATPVTVLLQPLQRKRIQRRVLAQVDRRDSCRRRPTEWPRRRLHQERPQMHMRNMRGEIIQPIEDMGRIFKNAVSKVSTSAKIDRA